MDKAPDITGVDEENDEQDEYDIKIKILKMSMTPNMYKSSNMRSKMSRNTTKKTMIPINTISLILILQKMTTMMTHKNMT